MSTPHRTGGTRRERVKPGLWRRTNADGSTTFEITYRDSDGRQRRETVGPRQREAEDRLSQRKADMSRGVRVAPRRNLTVQAAAEAWIASTGHLRPTTVAAYRAALDCYLLPAFGRRRLDAVTPDDVARWAQRATTLGYRIERDRAAHPDPASGAERARPTVPYRARTINLALTTLHRVYAHAIRRQGYAGTSPVAALERAERPSDEPKVPTVLTPEQLAAVVSHATPAYRPVLAFMAGTGCRIGEALGLVWEDVDLPERTARIAMQLDRKGRRVPVKTANGRRTLDLPGSLVTVLAAHRLASLDTAPGSPAFPVGWRSVARALAAACKAAGVPVVSPHALRHAHGSALLAHGEDLAAVSRRLGHGSVAVTAEVYAHLLEDDERRNARRDRLDALYGGGTVAAVRA
jgi:integrase